MVVFDGLDNCKEMSILFAGLEFSRRGFNTLSIDGPGQGESLRLRKIHSRYDYEVAGTAAYNYVASRADVDPKRVAVMAYSFGVTMRRASWPSSSAMPHAWFSARSHGTSTRNSSSASG